MPTNTAAKQHSGYRCIDYPKPSTLSAFERVGADCKSTARSQECEFSAQAPVYLLQIRHSANGKGAVLLSHVTTAYQSQNKLTGLVADQVRAFFSLPSSSTPGNEASVLGRLGSPQTGVASLFEAESQDLDVLGSGPSWQLVCLRRKGQFDAFSLRGIVSSPASFSTALLEKTPADFLLTSPGPELLHQGFVGNAPSRGVKLPPVEFNDEISIDLLVSPGVGQVPNADILSNHAGDFRGIAFEQSGEQQNSYSVVLGNGKEWMHAGELNLQPGRPHYISLQVKGEQTELYLDGKLIARNALDAPVASTNRPFYLGNWIGGDREFNGMINEVLIASGTRNAEQVQKQAVKITGSMKSDSK